jgi:hypothetical protein
VCGSADGECVEISGADSDEGSDDDDDDTKQYSDNTCFIYHVIPFDLLNE